MDSFINISSMASNDSSFEADNFLEGSESRPSSGTMLSKSRKPNWTSHEIRALILAYDRNRDLLRSRGVYKGVGERHINNAKRQMLWESITDEVNRSRPGFMRQGVVTFGNCVRTVKEVVKKWVNLVNKMKQDLAMQHSNPHHELCPISRAINTIVNTDDPLEYQDDCISEIWDSSLGGAQMHVKIEPVQYGSEDSLNSVEETSRENAQHQFPYPNGGNSNSILDLVKTKWNKQSPNDSMEHAQVPSDLKAVLNRHLKRVGNNDIPNEEEELRNVKRSKIAQDRLPQSVETHFQPFSSTGSSDYPRLSTDDPNSALMDEDLKATYRLNKEIMELQKKKLEIEIEKITVDKEKAQLEKEQLVIEKDVSLLRKEKLQLEVENLRQTKTEKVTVTETSESV